MLHDTADQLLFKERSRIAPFRGHKQCN